MALSRKQGACLNPHSACSGSGATICARARTHAHAHARSSSTARQGARTRREREDSPALCTVGTPAAPARRPPPAAGLEARWREAAARRGRRAPLAGAAACTRCPGRTPCAAPRAAHLSAPPGWAQRGLRGEQAARAAGPPAGTPWRPPRRTRQAARARAPRGCWPPPPPRPPLPPALPPRSP